MKYTEIYYANRFSREMGYILFKFDFSLESLSKDIDKFICSKRFQLFNKTFLKYRNLIGLEAYIGETLVRLYGGKWHGSFDGKKGSSNFYTSSIEFGGYTYKPSHFLSYRLSNGEGCHGTFSAHIKEVVHKIEQAQSNPSKL